MSEVVAFRGVAPSTERRALLLNEFAGSFDKYVADYGVEPDAYVTVFGGLKQTARVSWLIQGETEGGATTMLALASAVITRELVRPT